jgi:hypothetical protein
MLNTLHIQAHFGRQAQKSCIRRLHGQHDSQIGQFCHIFLSVSPLLQPLATGREPPLRASDSRFRRPPLSPMQGGQQERQA